MNNYLDYLEARLGAVSRMLDAIQPLTKSDDPYWCKKYDVLLERMNTLLLVYHQAVSNYVKGIDHEVKIS